MQNVLRFPLLLMLCLLMGVCVVPRSWAGPPGGGKKPNVLFIAVDDLRPELGCYGASAIRTPHIDQLAARGVLFNRAYCQLAVCNPSRASLMTGLRPDTIRVWDLETDFRDTVPDVVTLPQAFKKQGYRALSFGKIYHNPRPDHPSWSEPHPWPPKSKLWSAGARKRLADYREEMRRAGKSDKQVQRMRPQATEIVDIPDREHVDGAIAEQALAAMRRLAVEEQPFFLAAGFVRPHLPFVVPRTYWELYDAEQIPLAGNPDLPTDAPAWAMNTMYELRDYCDFADTPAPPDGALSTAQQRRLKHGYYASVSFIDVLVGRLLAELERLDLADDTIVVLWGDHGWKLGEHNSWCKQTNYEIDTRVPLIICAPGAEGNGRTTDALVEFVDLYPTLCELAGVPVPEGLDGKSIARLLAHPDQAGDRVAFSQFRRQDGNVPLMGYAMRTDRYRYVEWQDRRSGKVAGTELYDHAQDPGEHTNVAGRSEHASLLAELSRRMWSTLPKPPPYRTSAAKRPRAIFRNQGQTPVKIFWLPEGGEKQARGIIKPGSQWRCNTTLGHRFEVQGTGGYLQEFNITRPSETFDIKSAIAPVRSARPGRPNILFCMADDWSAPHAGVLGDRVVRTPNFDRVAREGVLFPNAFVSTPSCTPSRLSILTGQHHWRLREGDSLGGSLREDYEVYTEMLQADGYHVGQQGKGVWPSKHTYRKRDSFGEKVRSFKEFLAQRQADEPFCFWYGGRDPHRPYEFGIGKRSGISLDDITVPPCLPDHPVVRSDLADYYWCVERFDREVGELLQHLEAIGELDNTLVVVSGDNGMPFPRAKATLYDLGTRVPLAIRWGSGMQGPRVLDDLVSLCDMAPTFLEVAGRAPGASMTGISLLPLLGASSRNPSHLPRDFVLTGLEQHVYPNPARALRTRDFLFIRNVDPASWKTGEAERPHNDFSQTPWPTGPGAFAFNTDPSPTQQFLHEHRRDPAVREMAERVFGSRPEVELYDLRRDPDQLHNVAGQREYAAARDRLHRKLEAERIKSEDPRVAITGYSTQVVEGWPVRVSDRLMQKHAPATRTALALLKDQLRTINARVPDPAVDRLQTVPIWFSHRYPDRMPTGEYHPDAGWLRGRGYLPAKAEAVEFTNIPRFTEEIERMPMLVLHELAHAYHHQVLGHGNPALLEAYRAARDSGLYDKVARKGSSPQVAYAMENQMEYFAETTEAYFGENDFFPFNREDLEQHDPRMFKLLGQLWLE